MRVGYILPYLQKPSGWRNHTCSFLSAICQYVEPVLFVAAADRPSARELFPDANMFTLPATQAATLGSWRGRQTLWKTRQVIRRGNYPDLDLVHSLEAYPTGLVGSWLAAKLHRPHVITTHGTYGVVWHERYPDRLAYQRLLRKTDLICPVSHGTARLMRRYFGADLSKTPIRPILNGNDYYKTVPREAALERRPPAVPTLLSVGDVKPRKGQHISLAAFAKVKEQIPAARYEIIGGYEEGSSYYQQLQAFIAAQGLQDVTFRGVVSDAELRRSYEQASVFVLTPQEDGLHFEGFGLVYLEAGAYGLPVVATRTGGVGDAVKDGITGLLAEAGDVEGIAAAILRLLADPVLAQRTGRGNRQWAETLTWESYAAEQWEAYKALLEGKNGGKVVRAA